MNLKKYIKVPLLLLLINAGIQSSLGVVCLKLIGEFMVAKDISDHLGVFFTLIIAALIATASQIHSVNLAMRYFDQLEVIPIFMCCVLLLWMLSGLVIMNEK